MLGLTDVERVIRPFLLLHQDDDPVWYRAEGDCLCEVCRLPYRLHPYFDERTMLGSPIDHRLCNGDVVHL